MTQAPKSVESPAASPADLANVANIYAEVAQRSARLLTRYLDRHARHGVSAASDDVGVAKAFMDLSAHFLAHPFKLAQTQMNMMWDYVSLWQHTSLKMLGVPVSPLATPDKGDKRFAHADWENNALFDFMKQSYLLSARHVHAAVSDLEGLDPLTQNKVNFFTRQYLNALSPSNFALSNPEVFRETLNTRGENLLRGFNNLLHDLEAGDGTLRIRMTDTQAFELGRNVATTPGKVVFQNELMQLIQYTPTTPSQYKRPLLIVPPWINKYYILDLREKNSLVKWATDQGHSVFIMSWVNPDARLAHKTFEDYLREGTLAALDAVCQISGEKEVNAAGYCLGGTLLMTTLAYLAATRDRRIASATFFTSLVDFSDPGELGVFVDEASVSALEKKMAERGFLEGSEMAGTFNLLRANDLIWSFVVNNYLMGKDPFPFDLLYWNSDSTRMPYAMHSFYLRKMYLENALRKAGGITLAGVKIDVAKVKVPCYFISTIEDHIAPWKTTYAGALLPRGPVRFVLGGSGHIAGIVNPPAANKYGYWTNESLPALADDFLAAATAHDGSWWTDWHQWLLALPAGNAQVPARVPGSGPLPVIEDAPGAFARFRLDLQRPVAHDSAPA
ncbi:class I poly(R)-hydroxyalkanoic acid synthase [Rhodocyclus tenuis]|uniref:PHA/PHB synthase family protein n=1 Tax=Rhodocyclus gracilis TaxID=2929842 RepID=UPI001298E977|nr:class I poly(R)-hydroxyalkanoic acid synthase [Rhodocyclus gracilis]MRD72098.1 class I poly(R)-hydroxyalkanoic acid synthase [Rhodocyclus gracilis]